MMLTPNLVGLFLHPLKHRGTPLSEPPTIASTGSRWDDADHKTLGGASRARLRCLLSAKKEFVPQSLTRNLFLTRGPRSAAISPTLHSI